MEKLEKLHADDLVTDAHKKLINSVNKINELIDKVENLEDKVNSIEIGEWRGFK